MCRLTKSASPTASAKSVVTGHEVLRADLWRQAGAGIRSPACRSRRSAIRATVRPISPQPTIASVFLSQLDALPGTPLPSRISAAMWTKCRAAAAIISMVTSATD